MRGSSTPNDSSSGDLRAKQQAKLPSASETSHLINNNLFSNV